MHKVLRWGLYIIFAGVISLVINFIFYSGGYFIPLILIVIGIIVTIIGLVLNNKNEPNYLTKPLP